MSRWHALYRSRTAHPILSILLVLAMSAATFFLGRSITLGVYAEQSSRNRVHDDAWRADLHAISAVARHDTSIAGALLAAGGLIGLFLLRRRGEPVAPPAPWPSSWTLLFLLFFGSIAMLFVGLFLPAW